MKTINEVLDNMCNTAIEYLNDGNESHCPYELLMSFHRDVEVAVKAIEADRDNWRKQALAEDAMANVATCENSSQVGNAAKMREALENSNGLLEELALIGESSESAREQIAENKAALSAPPRNCDLLANAQDALATIHNDRCCVQNPIDERRLSVNWLFAEAEGERQ